MAKKENPYKTVGLNFHDKHVEFIDRAAEVGEQTRAEFIRDASIGAAAKVLGEDQPELPKIVRGRKDEISDAAEAAGMTRQQFIRNAALQAAGATGKVTAPKASKAPAKKKVARKKKG